ncbi:transketolase [Klebsiella pneumoniae]|uniref:Transketolase n=1 Tax=Klebsiella pneumoniae TaxID=573 RepID=A0A378BH91_KLEPN|nr:transketolase [Klebsiella pneumoniae]
MIASIADEGQATVPAPFGVALSKLAAQRPEIVGMTADLSKYTDLHIFAQAFPDRFFQMGMAEQLLMAAAGGMAKEGFIPSPPPMPPLQPVAPMILFTRSSPKSI